MFLSLIHEGRVSKHIVNLFVRTTSYCGLLDYLKSIITTEPSEDQINICAISAAKGGGSLTF